MLVAQRRLRGAVTQPAHELGEAGPGGGRQHRAGVAQVVEAEVGAADGGVGGSPQETLNLVVLEGLRQLGLDAVEVSTDDSTG